jgi:hypothetical protein
MYRVEIEVGTGVTAAEYLPCDIGAEPGPVVYRPVPSDPGEWIMACGKDDAECLGCSS